MAERIKSPIGFPRPSVSGFSFPVAPHPFDCLVLAMASQMEQTEKLKPEEIERAQLVQLHGLIRHAQTHVPYFGPVLKDLARLPVDRLTPAALKDLPFLTRTKAQEAGRDLYSQSPPKAHGATQVFGTSGSTGQPLTGQKTQLAVAVTQAATLRYHRWFERDLSQSNLSIQPLIDKVQIGESWAPGYRTGKSIAVPSNRDVGFYVKQIAEQKPAYIQSFPYLLSEIIHACAVEGVIPQGLKEVRSYGETVDDDMRTLAQEAWGVPWRDYYSSEEIGALAIECPHSTSEGRHYHVIAENVILEILDENGGDCAPGEMGRVVLTGLHGFAEPFLRYETGDYAIAHGQASCGNPLPAVTRFLGRVRNLIRLPSGERKHFPTYSTQLTEIAPFPQYWIEQNELGTLDFFSTYEADLSDQQVAALEDHFEALFKFRFAIRVHKADKAPRHPSGKFEIFKSAL